MDSSKEKKSDPTQDPKFQRVVQHFLKTPHTPHKGTGLPDHYFVVIDGRMMIASGKRPPDSQFTTDLYKNLSDLREGRIAESGVKLVVAKG
jgi:hypothetical protein